MDLCSIRLRWRGRCCRCGCRLAAGAEAGFDPQRHELWCSRCRRDLDEPARRAPLPATGERPDPDAVRRCIAEARATLAASRRAS